jgi:hypothetical protein
MPVIVAAAACVLACGGSSPVAPTPPTPAPTPSALIGQVALLGTSIPFGQSVPTVVLGTAGQAAPSLTFRVSVRTFAAQTGLHVEVWVRTETLRCMGAGLSRLDFAAGEEKIFNTFNVSFQNGNSAAPCRLPYSTTSVEILLFNAVGQQLVSQTFPGGYTFLPPSPRLSYQARR